MTQIVYFDGRLYADQAIYLDGNIYKFEKLRQIKNEETGYLYTYAISGTLNEIACLDKRLQNLVNGLPMTSGSDNDLERANREEFNCILVKSKLESSEHHVYLVNYFGDMIEIEKDQVLPLVVGAKSEAIIGAFKMLQGVALMSDKPMSIMLDPKGKLTKADVIPHCIWVATLNTFFDQTRRPIQSIDTREEAGVITRFVE